MIQRVFANLKNVIFPFLPYKNELKTSWIHDIIAGISVSLILIPQSIAYAKLAGVPPHLGLYAAFLPIVIASLYGSSALLGSGPTALTSLLILSLLTPYAPEGSAYYIELAILLALLTGIFEFILGVFRMGIIINLLSRPVIIGFSNAAALIITISQFDSLLDITLPKGNSFISDIFYLLSHFNETHLFTVGISLATILIIVLGKKINKTIPWILIAVISMTFVAHTFGYHKEIDIPISRILDPTTSSIAEDISTEATSIQELQTELSEKKILELENSNEGIETEDSALLRMDIIFKELTISEAQKRNNERLLELQRYTYLHTPREDGNVGTLHKKEHLTSTENTDNTKWHIESITNDIVHLTSGGKILGNIPSALPNFRFPSISLATLMLLIPSALILSLFGFIQTVTIASSVASETKKRLNINRELIGQGLSNIVSSLSGTIPISTSFSRTSINIQSGAKTPLSALVSALVVLGTIVYLSQYLALMPSAILGSIIVVAVSRLFRFHQMYDALKTHFFDGIVTISTFVFTIIFAPRLHFGILIGIALSLALHLYRTMKPRIVIMGFGQEHTLNSKNFDLEHISKKVAVIRFDGMLYFGNTLFFEEAALRAKASNPSLTHILILGSGINEIDSSGISMLRELITRMLQNKTTVCFVGMKKQVIIIFKDSGLFATIGEKNFFKKVPTALEELEKRINEK